MRVEGNKISNLRYTDKTTLLGNSEKEITEWNQEWIKQKGGTNNKQNKHQNDDNLSIQQKKNGVAHI